MKNRLFLWTILTLSGIGLAFYPGQQDTYQIDENRLVSVEIDPVTQHLKLYWKDEKNTLYRSFGRLKDDLKRQGKSLVFAMNGGMYMKDGRPLGLFIQEGQQKKTLNKVQDGYGNFYMHPNGVFYLTSDKQAVVCTSQNFKPGETVKYATQSGPMLLIDGKIHPKFNRGSTNLHIRNGVGVLPNGKVLFAMSKKPINFYDLATFFKQKGCQNALYLDGFVSRTYLPEKNWIQTDGNFGVIIGVEE